jgi:hypothetical protein
MTLLSGVYNFFRQRSSCNPQHVMQPNSPRTDDGRQSPYFPSSDDLSSSFLSSSLSSSSRSRSTSSISLDGEDNNAFVVVDKPEIHSTVIENKTEKKGFFKRVKEYFFSFRPRMRLPSLRRKSSASQEKPVSSDLGVVALGEQLYRVRKDLKVPKDFKKYDF